MTEPTVSRCAGRAWREDRPGVSYALLRPHDGAAGATLITRFAAGVRGGRHDHPGGEELYVLEGECEVDNVRLLPGDYLYTPANRKHELKALTDTTVLVVLPKLPIYDAEP